MIKLMKQVLLTLVLLVVLPLAVRAEVWKVDNVYFDVKENDNYNCLVAKVIHSPTGYSGDLVIPSLIKKPDDVNSSLYYGTAYVSCIDKDAFAGCSGLTSISMSIFFNLYYQEKAIPAGLFKDCYNLSRITLNNGKKDTYYSPEGSNAIIQGRRLIAGCKNTIIPSNVVAIGEEAFAGCKGLTEFTIPSHVGTIGNRAFADCTNLKSVNIFGYNEGRQYFPDDQIYIGPSLAISSTAFEGCTGLTTVTVKSGGIMGDEIGSGFSGCTALTEVIFEEGVEKIGEGAIAGCTGITSIRIPNSVKEVGAGAFEGCTGLTSVSIGGDGIKVVGAFGRCTALTDVIIEEGEKIIQNSDEANIAAYGSIGYSSNFDGCLNLRSLIVRGTITTGSKMFGSIFTEASIPNIYFSDLNVMLNSNQGFGSSYERYHMFLSGEALENPEDVTEQEHSYFVYRVEDEGKNKGKFVSYGLKDSYTTIPINVDADIVSAGSLNINAFKAWRPEYQNAEFILENGKYKCGWAFEVEHLKIPEGVTTIPDGAFWGCASLKSVTFPSSLTSIGETAFSFCDSLLFVLSPIEKPFTFKTDYTHSILDYSSLTVPPENVHYVYTGTRKGTVYYNIRKDLLTLYVPRGSVSDYKNTDDWNKFPIIIDSDPDNLYPGHHHEDVTITANSYTINYGDELPEFEYTTTGAALHGTPEITCEATKTSPVGTYPIVISKGTVTNTKTTFVNGTLTITKAPLTIKAGSYTKVEGEENPAFTLTYEGFKNNETSAVLTKQPTASCSATKNSPAGDYPVTVSGAEAQNYEISYVAGTLTVTANSGDDNPDGVITFADSKVKDICVTNWDTNDDGELSKEEAEAVTSIGSVFKGKNITSFDELRFFTGLTTIPQYAFSGCTSLTSIKLPKTITTIENYVFCYCYALMSLTIPASVTSIGSYEFEYCNSLSELIVEEGNTVYDSRDHCNAIIETMYNNLKYGCKNTVIPESVTQTGGTGVFYGIESLTSIHIPANISNINSGLFTDCKNLATITVAAENKKYDSRNNCNAIIETSSNEIIEGCKNTIIPNDVISIRYNAFRGRAWGIVKIPGNVKKIGNFAFYGSSELKTVVMEEGVEEIGEYAFGYCTLETIVLPSTVTTIKSYAFKSNNVKFIKSSITTPFEIPNDAFDCYSTATLYVPAGTKPLYEQATGWKGFENIVEMGAVKPGDANDDGYVNMTDVNAVKDYLMEGKTEGFQFFNADANGDKVVNAADIVKIINIIKSNSSSGGDVEADVEPDISEDPSNEDL